MGLMAMLEKALNGDGATATPATLATDRPQNARTVATVATVAVAQSPKPETERPNLTLAYSRPSQQEAGLCAARLQAFQAKGIATHEAQTLANQLVRRDRQLDDRRSCAECASFYARNCRKRINPIGETTIYDLHRCKGFEPTKVNTD